MQDPIYAVVVFAAMCVSAAIGFFQARPAFTPQSSPALPPGIDRLSIEMVSCDIATLCNVWSVLGVNYLPSALYKVRIDAGQLWGVFAIHTMWNWLQQVVFGLPNSGLKPTPNDALFSITPNAAFVDPIWGGGFGPEGTLGASLVLLALIGVTLRRPAKSIRPT